MNLEDLFANKNKQQKYQYKREYGYQKQPQFNWLSIYDKIKQNQKLRNIIIIGIAIILIIVIGLIVILLPLILKIFNFIVENGVSGLIEMGMELLNKFTSSIKVW
jgi:hypothetical protein